MNRDNHDKEILRTLKSIAASLKSIDKTLKSQITTNAIMGERNVSTGDKESDIEHITTDLLAERLNELEDLVSNDKIIIIAMEEMSELTQCLTKYLRATDENLTYDFDHLHEEFADVLICMNHLKSIFGFDTQETRKRMLEKLDRAIERSK